MCVPTTLKLPILWVKFRSTSILESTLWPRSEVNKVLNHGSWLGRRAPKMFAMICPDTPCNSEIQSNFRMAVTEKADHPRNPLANMRCLRFAHEIGLSHARVLARNSSRAKRMSIIDHRQCRSWSHRCHRAIFDNQPATAATVVVIVVTMVMRCWLRQSFVVTLMRWRQFGRR